MSFKWEVAVSKNERVALKDARKKGQLKKFIREHENDATGDLDDLDAAISPPASRSSKEAQEASNLRTPRQAVGAFSLQLREGFYVETNESKTAFNSQSGRQPRPDAR